MTSDTWTPEREGLKAWLDTHAPVLGAAYGAAVRLLGMPDFPARPHLLGHLVREIANGLPEIISERVTKRFESTKALDELAVEWSRAFPEPSAFAEPSEGIPPSVPVDVRLVRQVSRLVHDHTAVAQTNRDKVAILIDALRPGTLPLRKALEPVLGDWAGVVAWFMSLTHLRRQGPIVAVDEDELQAHFRRFEAGLSSITEGHFVVVDDIDRLLASRPPSEAMLDRLMPMLAGAEQMRHFFRSPRLEDKRWLELLRARGFFDKKSVPEPVVDLEAGVVTHARWPASSYLARMASLPDCSELVADIAAQIVTTNTCVREDLVQILRNLSAPLAVRLLPNLLMTLRKTGWRWARLDDLLDATIALGEAGKRKEALDVLMDLLQVRPDASTDDRGSVLRPRPRMVIDPQELSRLLRRRQERLTEVLGSDIFDVVASALRRSLQLSRRNGEKDAEDYSNVWLPRVESGDDDDVREVLARATLDTAETLLAAGVPVTEIIDALEKHRWTVFRRMVLYLLSVDAAAPVEVVAARILDRRMFDSISVRREYRMVVKAHFARLSEGDRRRWLDWIEEEVPPAEAVRGRLERWEMLASDEGVARYQRRWHWEHLAPAVEGLPAEWSAWWEQLQREFGEAEPADAAHYPASGGAFQWESPIDIETLKQMAPRALADYLKAPAFPRDRPFVVPEGLREKVAALVAHEPGPYADEATSFQGLSPVYVRGVLDGCALGSSAGRRFEWKPVLDLAEWVLEQGVDTPEPEPNLTEDAGWGWARWTITRMLEDALKADPSTVPLECSDQVWRLIGHLLSDPLGSRRADAISLALQFVYWKRSHIGQPHHADGTLNDAPEVRLAFDRVVSTEDADAAVHEVVGRWVPWLIFMDSQWVESSLAHIFPRDESKVPLLVAAWRGYLRSGAPFHEQPIYEQMVASLEGPSTEDSEQLRKDLSEHLAVAYGNGTLAKRGASTLLERFLDRAPLELREHFLWFVGHDLSEQAENVPPEVVERFQELCDARIRAAQANPSVRAELPSFGIWFGCELFDPAWTLDRLESVLGQTKELDYEHLVVARLATLPEEHVAKAIRCLELLVGGLNESGSVHGWLDDGRRLLERALRGSDPAARAAARSIFHKLGTLGFAARGILHFSDAPYHPDSIPYFTSDQPMAVNEIKAIKVDGSLADRKVLVGRMLRRANPVDVLHFCAAQEIEAGLPDVMSQLGEREAYWRAWLEDRTKRQ